MKSSSRFHRSFLHSLTALAALIQMAALLSASVVGAATQEIAGRKRNLQMKRMALFRDTLVNPANLVGPPASESLVAGQGNDSKFPRRRILKGTFDPELVLSDDGEYAIGKARPGTTVNYGGREYREITNAPVFQTRDPRTGNPRSWFIGRAIRDYVAKVDLRKGTPKDEPISEKKYVSDDLLFEEVDGEVRFVKVLVESSPEHLSFLEDPRVSIGPIRNGRQIYLLAMTDYSPHVPGRNSPDVMNRYTEFSTDPRTGEPTSPKANKRTGRPIFKDLSPAPIAYQVVKRELKSTEHLYTDPQNAVISVNPKGELIVATHFQPDFQSSELMAMNPKGQHWEGGTQSWAFRDRAHFESYDWDNMLTDLLGGPDLSGNTDRPKPLEVRMSSVASSPKENTSSTSVKLRKGVVYTDYVYTDAKNGVISVNDDGEVIVDTRFRPDFNHEQVKAINPRAMKWKYAIQTWRFKDWDHFESYKWENSLHDLLGSPAPNDSPDRVKPLEVKVMVEDKDLKENFPDPRVDLARGKGVGPGANVIRVRRDGEKLFVSLRPGMPEFYAGKIKIPKDGKEYIMADKEVNFLSGLHEIRFFKDKRGNAVFDKRHYSAPLSLRDRTMMNMKAYYSDAIQPTPPLERGHVTGILDLHHVYLVGVRIIFGKDGRALLAFTGGASDAHSFEYVVDLEVALSEMSPGSERVKSGQVRLY